MCQQYAEGFISSRTCQQTAGIIFFFCTAGILDLQNRGVNDINN